MAAKVTRPKGLSNEAGALYEATVKEFAIDDAVARTLLQTGCEAFDRLKEAQAILRKQGLTVRNARGVYPHPAIQIERHSRSAMLAAFRALHLEPPKAAK